MQIHKSIQNLNEVKSCIFLAHSLYRFKVVKKLSSRTIVQNKTDKIVSFKAVVKLDYEGMVEH
jgi:hypothetical protein